MFRQVAIWKEKALVCLIVRLPFKQTHGVPATGSTDPAARGTDDADGDEQSQGNETKPGQLKNSREFTDDGDADDDGGSRNQGSITSPATP
jgi:hypothetical protein